ncbi:MAG: IdeS/Mac family cysteine endopeptidase [Deltaproteobacteria bacterium]|nr:IdeS/Mac family cysteine endopeptidase [Deltaproteobacteria bacterium]
MRWWFDGTNEGEGISGLAVIEVDGGGAFWTGYDFYDYLSKWHDWEETDYSQSLYRIQDYLHAGLGVSIGIYGKGWGHYINIWGYEYDSSGNVLGLYLTDNYNTDSVLQYFDVSLYADNYWHLVGYYDNPRIGRVYGLQQRVPEPGTLALLGIGVIGLAAVRKRSESWKAGRQ